jgi:hypothetical protein
VAVAGIGVMNVESLQKAHLKPGVMPDFSPFLNLHNSFCSKQGDELLINLLAKYAYCTID